MFWFSSAGSDRGISCESERSPIGRRIAYPAKVFMGLEEFDADFAHSSATGA